MKAHTEVTRRSGIWLRQRLKVFFGERPFVYCDPLFPHWKDELVRLSKGSEPVAVVLVGSPQRRFVDLIEAGFQKVELFVLSSVGKQILIDVFGMPRSYVAVIPRYSLAAPHSTLRRLSSEETDLICAGRFATVKGVLHLLEVVSLLQTTYLLPYRLRFLGEFDEMTSHLRPDRFFSHEALNRDFTDQIRRLKWTEPPRVIRGLGIEEWTLGTGVNPTLVSLSQHTHEDFAVSVAQAQALGWPTVLSAWNAHLDCRLENTIMLTVEFDVMSTGRRRRDESARIAFEIASAVDRSCSSERPVLASGLRIQGSCSIDYINARKMLIAARSRYPGLHLGKNQDISVRLSTLAINQAVSFLKSRMLGSTT